MKTFQLISHARRLLSLPLNPTLPLDPNSRPTTGHPTGKTAMSSETVAHIIWGKYPALTQTVNPNSARAANGRIKAVNCDSHLKPSSDLA